MKKRIFVVAVCARYCVVVDPAQHPEVQILQFRMLLRLLRQKTRREHGGCCIGNLGGSCGIHTEGRTDRATDGLSERLRRGYPGSFQGEDRIRCRGSDWQWSRDHVPH